jgi:DNA-binding transcriptional LysR family regulator
MINIAELRVFVTAAEEDNFSRAAERLQLSQSAVSQNIQSIEKTYGVELFVRRGRTVELSEAGQTILPMARKVLNSARLLEDAFQHVNSQVGGELLIGCSPSAGKYVFPTLLSSFQQLYSAVRPRVKVMPCEEIIERLMNETLPIGITSCKIEHRLIECVPLFDDILILIVPVDHPWAITGKAIPGDILSQPLIVREESSGSRNTVIDALKGNNITEDMLNISMELGNAEAIEMAVECGLGVAFVSEMVAARGLALNRVKKVDVEGLQLRRTIYMAHKVGYPFTQAQARFWDYAQEQKSQLGKEIWNSLTDLVEGQILA